MPKLQEEERNKLLESNEKFKEVDKGSQKIFKECSKYLESRVKKDGLTNEIKDQEKFIYQLWK